MTSQEYEYQVIDILQNAINTLQEFTATLTYEEKREITPLEVVARHLELFKDSFHDSVKRAKQTSMALEKYFYSYPKEEL